MITEYSCEYQNATLLITWTLQVNRHFDNVHAFFLKASALTLSLLYLYCPELYLPF